MNHIPMASKQNKEKLSLYTSKSVHQKKSIKSTSKFTAELYGILEAISHSANVAKENILIATDSKSSIQVIRKVYSRNPKVQKIHRAIRKKITKYSPYFWYLAILESMEMRVQIN